jgi:hypothetical protein
MATIKVNLTKIGHACELDETPAGVWPRRGWYLFLQNCDGTPFKRGGKYYERIPVDYGYAEIPNVPPGLYILFAIVNPFHINDPSHPNEIVYQSNYTSHFAMVNVCCGCQDVCVTLYNSGWHYCVHVIVHWFWYLIEQKQIDGEVANNAIKALTKLLDTSGKTLPTDANIIEQLMKITKEFKTPSKK